MYCIVPLAGPDFYNDSYGIKPLFKFDNETLIKRAIYSRSWYQNKELVNGNIIFILRDTPHTNEAEIYLKDTFTGCKIVRIPELTRGALLSSCAGFSIIKDFTRPVVVDLVDIIYKSDFSPAGEFERDINIGGILPFFKSTNEKYSYLEIVMGHVTQTAEKKVISDNASAGTYFFRDTITFFEACTDSLKFDKVYSFKNNLFLCPAFNGIIRSNKRILGVEVHDVEEVSLKFHN